MRRVSLRALISAWVLGCMTACGGGGDGASSGGNPPGPTPVSITAQPSSITAVDGTAAAFSVTVTGDGLVFQWERSSNAGIDWASVAGATAASYSISPVDSSLDGCQFRVRISGTTNTVTSSAATLSITPAPTPVVITSSPSDVLVVAGSDASFAVTATGTSPSYQWQSSSDGVLWSDLTLATSTTLTLPLVPLADNGKRVRVVVTNGVNMVISGFATLTVTAPTVAPEITTGPLAVSVIQGSTARFAVVASGNPAPSFQWQQSPVGGTSFADIPSATASVYITPATVPADSGRVYRVLVSNSAGTRVSSSVILTVSPTPVAPAISLDPIGEATRAPTTVTYRAAATGTPTPTYQWQLSTDYGTTYANINGATSTTYTPPATLETDSGKRYRMVASNSVGSATSLAGRLTVGSTGLNGGLSDIVVDSGGSLFVGAVSAAPSSTAPELTFGGVYKISPAGVITVLAGGHGRGFVDGTGVAARFEEIAAVALDQDGNVYAADAANHAIRKISPQGMVTTLAGGTSGFADGIGAAARFNRPQGVAVDAGGNVFVSDTENNAIRRITPEGQVSTFAGSGEPGSANGQGTAARIYWPRSLSFGPNGNLYVADTGSNLVRVITPQGNVTTCATGYGVGCDAEPPGGIQRSALTFLRYLRVDAAGRVLVSVSGIQLMRVDPVTAAVTLLAGPPSSSGPFDGEGGNARFGSLGGVGVDSSGNAYGTDAWGMSSPVAAKRSVYMIRKVTPAGMVTTLTLAH
jgi:hypothetical protein